MNKFEKDIIEYCKKMGWDYNNLTTNQLLQLSKINKTNTK